MDTGPVIDLGTGQHVWFQLENTPEWNPGVVINTSHPRWTFTPTEKLLTQFYIVRLDHTNHFYTVGRDRIHTDLEMTRLVLTS